MDLIIALIMAFSCPTQPVHGIIKPIGDGPGVYRPFDTGDTTGSGGDNTGGDGGHTHPTVVIQQGR